MIEPNFNQLTITQQCTLLDINRSSYYYKPTGLSSEDLKIMAIIDEVYTMHPYFGMRSMAKHLQAQGVQFTSENFIKTLKNNNIKISMDGKGRALDNVFIERFWKSLKQEKIYLINLITVAEAKANIKEYMNFYNGQRMHQALNYKTPEFVYFDGSYLLKNVI